MSKKNIYEKVQTVIGWVQEKKVTAYRISQRTEAREMSIIAVAQGRAKIDNISFRTALELIKFYDEYHKQIEAGETLGRLPK